MSVKPVETRRLYLQIADKLRDLIEQQGFAPNGRLPSERELAQTLGVSRPSVREALVALELEGRVEIRMGSGVYICATPANAAAPKSGAELGESPVEIMTARSVIEGAIAASVAPFAKPKALKALRALYRDRLAELTVAQSRSACKVRSKGSRAKFIWTISSGNTNLITAGPLKAPTKKRHGNSECR